MSPDPLHDDARLEAIARLRLFEPEVRGMLERYARDAAERLELPLGLVSIVLDEAQYFAASHGLPEGWLREVQGTPVEWSFCRYEVEDDAPFVVADATQHPRTKDNPLVRLDGIRCYAGYPLRTSDGYVIGSFCVIGPDPHEFGEEDIELLRGMAAEVMQVLEKRAGY
ncbi:MAG: hypothetical protein E1N59_836 [Puniceicoccaceae bacterium 5H]|nr:MAG: hypothetical protein E1N59_836 [Puniceicoccaceae bacterium 5H]